MRASRPLLHGSAAKLGTYCRIAVKLGTYCRMRTTVFMHVLAGA